MLLGVDFQKAFNQMEYSACVGQLELLGASQGTIGMVKSFLRGRRMKITINGVTSTPVPLLRGSPQGSVMGCALYCATTQCLQKPRQRLHSLDQREESIEIGSATNYETEPALPRIPDAAGDSPRFFPDSGSDNSETGVRFWDRSTAEESDVDELHVFEEGGDRDLGSFKYIDDTTLVHGVALSAAVKHFTTSMTVEQLNLKALEERFLTLVENAEVIGIKINCSKTQLLIISPNNGCNTTGALNTIEGPISSVGDMKLVGFGFGSTPDCSAHVRSILEKFRIRIWLLFHLREAGIKRGKLFMLFCVYMRSVIEYRSPVYWRVYSAMRQESASGHTTIYGKFCRREGSGHLRQERLTESTHSSKRQSITHGLGPCGSRAGRTVAMPCKGGGSSWNQ